MRWCRWKRWRRRGDERARRQKDKDDRVETGVDRSAGDRREKGMNQTRWRMETKKIGQQEEKGGRERGEATYVGLGEKRKEIKRLKGDDWKKKGEEKQEFEVGRWKRKKRGKREHTLGKARGDFVWGPFINRREENRKSVGWKKKGEKKRIWCGQKRPKCDEKRTTYGEKTSRKPDGRNQKRRGWRGLKEERRGDERR